jgi:5-methylthioadenosine/S-adenosylhomocysteine deaminase
MRTVIRNARVLTMDRAGTEYERATVEIEDGVIRSVEPVERPGMVANAQATEIDGTGHLLMPGLVNAHFHSSVNHLKGALDGLPLELFMLFESPFEARPVEPRTAYVRTLIGAVEMLKSGTTCVLDDAFFVPTPSHELIDAVMQAYADSGMRAVVALDQPNVPEIDKLPFLDRVLPPGLRARLAAAPAMDTLGLLECYEHLVGRWHGSESGRLRAAVSCSAPQRVTRDYFGALEDLSRRLDLPFYVHVLETKLQRVLGDERYAGRSLIRHVYDEGLLTERMNIVHGIWLDEADMDLIADAGAVVAHNPISNLRLGSGIMPFRELRSRGIPICLGTDEAIADDAVNMWAVAKLAGLIHNVAAADYAHWPTAAEVMDCLVRGGARAMRSPAPIGEVSVGHQADLILVDLDTLAFTPLNDLHRQLVYCENGSSVRLTMVAGRIVYERGAVTSIDERALRREAREIWAGADAKGGERGTIDEWLPYYREMYLRAAARDVGLKRRIGDVD